MGDSMGGRQMAMPGRAPAAPLPKLDAGVVTGVRRQMSASAAPTIPPGGSAANLTSAITGQHQMTASAPGAPPERGGRRILLDPGVKATGGQRQMSAAAPAVPPERGGRRILLDAGVVPRKPGLDVAHMLQTAAETGQNDGNAAESATGGVGPALMDLVKQTASRAQDLIKALIKNRDGSLLIDLERQDRLRTVEILRQQRAERLREGGLRREGISARIRRSQLQRERNETMGRATPGGAAERRNRTTAEAMRQPLDRGTLRSQRMPGAEQERGAGIRSITDARRALPAPGRAIEGQSRALSVLPRGMGAAPTGAARPMRLAQGAAPALLRLAAPQTVNHSPTQGAPRTPGLGIGGQRGAGIAAMGQSLDRGR